eukprot:TRINITY_DN2362_c0_g1_i1.p1 TRINITY_DN2362_c0_g1~~TRINITY_DN2362_c0_g1_i1.p1  ORF type:complete len:136 (+),score=32.82 TRINITY_DN2362_c0_g1_i1:25-432(+)
MSRGNIVPADLDFEHDDGEFGDDNELDFGADPYGRRERTLLDEEDDDFDTFEQSNTTVGRIRRGVFGFVGSFWNGALWVGRVMKPFVYYGLVPFILGFGASTTKTSMLAVIWPLADLPEPTDAQLGAMPGAPAPH